MGGGKFSRWANEALRAGDQIDVMTPEGRFFTPLDAAKAKHYAAFVAGSGITPVLSLIRTTLAREPKSRFTLVYGNRRQSSVMFHEALEDLKDRYLTRFRLLQRFLARSAGSRAVQRPDRCRQGQAVPRFIGTARHDRRGVRLRPADDDRRGRGCTDRCRSASQHVHVERFGIPTEHAQTIDDAEAAQSHIELIVDGVRREVDFIPGQHSILDAGREAGIDLPFSCKGGMCSTCRAKVLDGQVRMAKNYALEPHEVAEGFVLTCQSYPLTERVVISYDAR